MSKWVRVLFLNYLPKILLMKRPNHNERSSKKSYTRANNPSELSDMSRNYTVNARSDLLELSDMHHPNCRMNRNLGNESSRPDLDTSATGSESTFQMTPETHKAIEAVRFIAAHLKNEDDYAEILEDWRYIAMVIDRLQLCIFLAVTIGGTVGILINAPHIFEYIDQDEIISRITGTTDT